jgi:hypothetical protein
MLLAVDVGNSQTVIGVFDGSDLARHWRISTEAGRTPDEHALVFEGLLAFADLVLWVRLRDDDGWVAVAQMRPTRSSASLIVTRCSARSTTIRSVLTTCMTTTGRARCAARPGG